MQKGECKLISKTPRNNGVFDVVYDAALFSGNYKKQRCYDILYKQNGHWKLVNTAPSVTYYELLMKQLKK